MYFYESILSVRLLEKGIKDTNLGYIFGLSALCYTIASPIVGLLIRGIGGIFVIQASFVASVISLFLFGPSEILGFPDNVTYTIAGISMLGVSMSGYFVAGLSLII